MSRGFRQLVANVLPGNVQDLMKRTNCARSTIRLHIRALRQEKLVHIGHYDRISNGWTPHYVAGPGRDSKRPAPLTNAQYSQNFRDRLHKSGEIDTWYARRNAVEYAKRVAKKPQTWLSIIGG